MMKNPLRHQVIFLAIIFVYMLVGSAFVYAQQAYKKEDIEWYSFNDAIELAKDHNKKVMLFMEADWCSVCKKMKKKVFPDQDVQDIMRTKFYPVRMDIESDQKLTYQQKEMSFKAFSKYMNMYATPTFIFLDEKGKVIGNKPGYMETEELMTLLRYIYTNAYENKTFEEYSRQ